VVAIDPIEMANSLASIRNDLTRLIAEFDADRLVLDSVSLLEMMYDHPAKRRSEVFGFTRSLKEAGVTTLLTSEANEKNPYASRHGIVEYLTDAVFVLQYIRGTDFRDAPRRRDPENPRREPLSAVEAVRDHRHRDIGVRTGEHLLTNAQAGQGVDSHDCVESPYGVRNHCFTNRLML